MMLAPTDIRLCPSLFMVNAIRVDSPTTNLPIAYEADAEFFKRKPTRRFHLRPALYDEGFDSIGELSDWMKFPALHVGVLRIVPGLHLIAPVWRGKPFYGQVSTDAELGMILSEMKRRGGIDHSAVNAVNQMLELMLSAPEVIN